MESFGPFLEDLKNFLMLTGWCSRLRDFSRNSLIKVLYANRANRRDTSLP